MCSDLQGEKTLEYLKIENVSAPCEEFEYDLSVLEIPKIPTGMFKRPKRLNDEHAFMFKKTLPLQEAKSSLFGSPLSYLS